MRIILIIFYLLLLSLPVPLHAQTKRALVIGLGEQQDKAWNKINGDKDVPLVQSTIHELDPTAFIVVTDAYDTFGEGFKPLPSKDEIQNI